MYEIFDAIKYWIINKFETKLNSERDEIEYLRMRIHTLEEANALLVEKLLHKDIPIEPILNEIEDAVPIRRSGNHFIPWAVQRARLEANDRIKAQNLQKEAAAAISKKVEITEPISNDSKVQQLEKELGVE